MNELEEVLNTKLKTWQEWLITLIGFIFTFIFYIIVIIITGDRSLAKYGSMVAFAISYCIERYLILKYRRHKKAKNN